MKQSLLSFLFTLLPVLAWADAIEIDGIWYNLIAKAKVAEVTKNPNNQYDGSYSGAISIPASVEYQSVMYNVTSIGEGAFRNCYELTSVTIPESVTSIGYSAFDGCTSLIAVNIPNSVSNIGHSSFQGCFSLKSISLPSDLSQIESYMFSGCENLVTINFPDKLLRIGNGAFNRTAWLDNKPDSIVYVGNVVYCYKGLMPENSQVVIKNDTYSISPFAFSYQPGLVSLVVPNSVKYVGEGAFNNTPWYDNLSDGIVYIGSVAYSYKGVMSENTEIIFEENTTSISDRSFSGCSGLTSVIIPNSVTSIGNSAFDGCRGLKKITLGSGIKEIGNNAFSGCYSLQNIQVDENCKNYDSRGNCNCLIETATNNLIQGSNNSTIPDGITSISSAAFYGCSELSTINIPSSVISIGNSAFKGCSNLTSVIIPNGTTVLGNNAFEGCTNLLSITISQSVKSIGMKAFSCSSRLESIIVEKGNSFYDSRENCNAIIYSASDSLILGCKQTLIPKNIKKIGDGAFWGADLSTISIPSSVEVICWDAFRENRNLQSVKIPEGVKEIKGGAFCYCLKLSEVVMANSVAAMGYSVFEGTQWLDNQPDGIVYIGKIAYIYKGVMPSGTKLVLREGTLGIASSAFSKCYGITSIVFPSSLISIGDYSFQNCSSLDSVIFPNKLETIGVGAFGWSGVETVVLGSKIKYIAFNAFPYNIVRDVYCYATEVPYAEGYVFTNGGTSSTLHVPSNSIQAYSTAMEWEKFPRIVGLTDSDPTPTSINSLYCRDCETKMWTDLKGQQYANPPYNKGMYILKGKKIVVH